DRPGDPERRQALSAGAASRDGHIAAASAGGAVAAQHHPPAERSVGEELVLVLDFGSQYSQLIARRVREAGVYCELIAGSTPWSSIRTRQPIALILSGGPASVYGAGAPLADPAVLRSDIPVLGICYGMQVLAHQLGGRVAGAGKREYGPATVKVEGASELFADVPAELPVWMSHGDTI